jgi:hypothetical protein
LVFQSDFSKLQGRLQAREMSYRGRRPAKSLSVYSENRRGCSIRRLFPPQPHPLGVAQRVQGVWSRCDAEASPDRGFYYHPSRPSAGQPIVAGWAYQWIAQLGFSRDGWVAQMDVMRVQPKQNANEVAAEQVKGLLHRLPEREEEVPLFVFDAGHDPVQLQQGLEGCRVQILVRLRAGHCFYADPPPPKWTGRPPRHGRKLDCKDPETWPAPSAEHHCEAPGYGSVRVRAWAGLHPKTQDHPTRGTRRPRPIVRGTLVLVEVTHLPRLTREPRALWL